MDSLTPDDSKTPKSIDELVKKNVAAVSRIEAGTLNNRTRADVVADAIAGFCGSIAFVYVHCVIFTGWLLWNGLFPKGMKFDPPPFNVLTLAVSLEAIFLSTFILISQNRQQRTADQRNHLDLQINMLAEQESSQMLLMMKRVMEHLKIEDTDLVSVALEEATDPERLARQIQDIQEPDSGKKKNGA